MLHAQSSSGEEIKLALRPERIEHHPALDEHRDGICVTIQIEFLLLFISINNKFVFSFLPFFFNLF